MENDVMDIQVTGSTTFVYGFDCLTQNWTAFEGPRESRRFVDDICGVVVDRDKKIYSLGVELGPFCFVRWVPDSHHIE